MSRKKYRAGDETPNYRGAELSDKTLGIIGFGHIGKEVARLANAFNMQVLGYRYRPVKVDDEVKKESITSAHLMLEKN